MDNRLKKIAVVGHIGICKTLVSAQAVAKLIEDKVNVDVIVVDDNKPDLLMDRGIMKDIAPFAITNPYYDLPEINGGKKFVCKGKHEYRKNNGKWICQCGRKL